ncbi:MAG: cbb3-type cytochrome c oxidase N-terminal domain-containing protein [Owenweeksia sp.]|nr:cbb3-type cytochrome c oxidase N-terminal domain-containing protein [Owenweeksia sp.]
MIAKKEGKLPSEAEVEAEEAKIADQPGWFEKLMQKLQDSKPIEEEEDIDLDHDYDGIRELDNNLPPWWLYGFYATIIIAVIYLLRYHVFETAPDAARRIPNGHGSGCRSQRRVPENSCKPGG